MPGYAIASASPSVTRSSLLSFCSGRSSPTRRCAPAGVPTVEPDIRAAVTIRQQLDKHYPIPNTP